MSRSPSPTDPRSGLGGRLRRLPVLRYLDRLRRRTERGLDRMEALHALTAVDYRERRLREDRRYRDPRHLAHSEQPVFSQGGEDGVLQEIFRRISPSSRTFAEFGAGKGWANNTVLLLQQGWTGAWLEAAASSCRRIERDFEKPLREERLRLRQAFLDTDNVAAELKAAGVDEGLDLLSIDVDGNDYWLWQALGDWRPRVVVIEYNALYPAEVPWVMPYDPQHRWHNDAWFGASLKSLEDLGRGIGYRLVGCTLAGTNAFFVRDDLADPDAFLDPFTAEVHYEPPRYFLLTRPGHGTPGRPVPL